MNAKLLLFFIFFLGGGGWRASSSKQSALTYLSFSRFAFNPGANVISFCDAQIHRRQIRSVSSVKKGGKKKEKKKKKAWSRVNNNSAFNEFLLSSRTERGNKKNKTRKRNTGTTGQVVVITRLVTLRVVCSFLLVNCIPASTMFSISLSFIRMIFLP